MGHGMETPRHTPPRKHTWLYWVVPVSLVLIVLIGAGAWLGVRGLAAKHALETAQSLIVDLQAKASAKDFKGAAKDARLIRAQTKIARDYTSDPVWRVAENIPHYGNNLAVVRQLADVVNEIANDAIDPAADLLSNFSLDSLKPVKGHINLEPIRKANVVIGVADKSLKNAVNRMRAIDTSQTLPVVTQAVKKLDRLLAKASRLTGELHTTLPLLVPMLGGDGERNYIVLFQNNAESTSLGGAASAWVILNVNNGKIAITAQPGSADFPRVTPPKIPMQLDPEVVRLFSLPGLGFSNNVTVIPDFPSASKLAQAFWERKTGQKVDGVMSFDPIVLGYLLSATGPLTLASGDVLTSQNAVQLLLSEVYARFSDKEKQSKYFSSAASTIFSSLTSAAPNINQLITSLTLGVNEHRLMVWSDHPEEEKLLLTMPLSGVQLTSNKKSTEIGLFFNEHSASKMSYYLKTAAVLTSTQCQVPSAPVFGATVTLHSDISVANEKLLPSYVRSQFYKKPVKTQTLVYVYGPVGASFTDFTYNGGGLEGHIVTTSVQASRPVVLVSIDLTASEIASFVVHFTGKAGIYGPLGSRITPMIQPTVVTLDTPGCAAVPGSVSTPTSTPTPSATKKP